MTKPTVLITGATGYVGGRLRRVIDRDRYRIRVMARRPEHIDGEDEVVRGDALEPNSLPNALEGVDTAYYLIHSMGSTGDFVEQDRAAAQNFAYAASAAGVRRIIYLGGLGDAEQDLSTHLRSRQEVGDELRSSGVQTIEFRASIVIGSGSLSFELIRALTERLPIMTTPKWVDVPAQPIAIGDLLRYLQLALEKDFSGSEIFEIGGKDVVSYGGLMKEYARQRGLKRVLIPVPVLTPGLSSRWLGLVTPVYARIGRKLIDSVKHETLVTDTRALEVFDFQPVGVRDAMASALRNEEKEYAQSKWSDAVSSVGERRDFGGVRFGNRLVDSRTISTTARRSDAFKIVEGIGGKTGWYFGDWLWTLRGFLDLIVGGAGMRRGRKNPTSMKVGDVVDCWRVEKFEPGGLVRFEAEMKLPGRAWLEFEFTESDTGTLIRQTAIFDPIGLAGIAYWYALYPIHDVIFAGMLRSIAKRAAQPSSPLS